MKELQLRFLPTKKIPKKGDLVLDGGAVIRIVTGDSPQHDFFDVFLDYNIEGRIGYGAKNKYLTVLEVYGVDVDDEIGEGDYWLLCEAGNPLALKKRYLYNNGIMVHHKNHDAAIMKPDKAKGDVKVVVHPEQFDNLNLIKTLQFLYGGQQIYIEEEPHCPHPEDPYRCGLVLGCDGEGCNSGLIKAVSVNALGHEVDFLIKTNNK
jgi:hypothetical protein